VNRAAFEEWLLGEREAPRAQSRCGPWCAFPARAHPYGCRLQTEAIEEGARGVKVSRYRDKAHGGTHPDAGRHQEPLESNKNFEDDTFEPDENVEEPRKVLVKCSGHNQTIEGCRHGLS
jgi:hypothetical protein